MPDPHGNGGSPPTSRAGMTDTLEGQADFTNQAVKECRRRQEEPDTPCKRPEGRDAGSVGNEVERAGDQNDESGDLREGI